VGRQQLRTGPLFDHLLVTGLAEILISLAHCAEPQLRLERQAQLPHDEDVERSLEHPDHLQSYGYAPSLKAKDDRPLTTERRETFPQQTPGLPTVAEPGSRPVARIHPSGRLGTSQAASQRVLGGQLSGRQPVPRDLRNITVAWASPMGNVGPNDGFGSRDPPVEVLQQGRERRVFRHPTITTQVGPACRRSSMS